MADAPQLDLFGAAAPIASAPALAMPERIERSAVISGCGGYRYLLTRTWSPSPHALFVLLNPSTADATTDDPTVRRCIGFAHAWGCGGMNIVNVFAFRATDPRALWAQRWDRRIGPDNNEHIRDAIAIFATGPIVVGWGRVEPPSVNRELVRARVAEVLELLRESGRELNCLGTNGDGSPKHPLYLSQSVRLQPFTLPSVVDDEDES